MVVAYQFLPHYYGEYSWRHWEEFNPFESTAPVPRIPTLSQTASGTMRHRISTSEVRIFLNTTIRGIHSILGGTVVRGLQVVRDGGLENFETDPLNTAEELGKVRDCLESAGILARRRRYSFF